MKIRKNKLGNKNVIGAQITRIRKTKGLKQKEFISFLQVEGLDINPTSVSKLEGQTRQVTDKEIIVIAKVLGVLPAELFLQE